MVVAQTKNTERFEMDLSRIDVISRPTTTLPIEISKNSKVDALALSTMLDYRPLTLRSEKARAIFKIEAELCAGFREFLSSQRFTEIHSPKIVATGTEGGANLFPIEYFGRKVFLAQSPQFYKQIMVGAKLHQLQISVRLDPVRLEAYGITALDDDRAPTGARQILLNLLSNALKFTDCGE